MFSGSIDMGHWAEWVNLVLLFTTLNMYFSVRNP